MTVSTTIRPPALDSAELQAILGDVAADARHRRETGGGRPDVALDLVRRHRLGAVRVPLDAGGGGYTKRELFTLLIRLAEADPDVPHILRLHYGFVEEILRSPQDHRGRLVQVLDGVLFGGASSELSGQPGVYTYDTTLTPDGDGYRLNGRKFYSTGSLYSDFLRVAADDDAGHQVSVLIPAHRDGVTHVDDWDGIGQRETGSGTTVLDDVRVEADEVLPFRHPDGRRPRGAQAQLLLHAVAAGILRAVTSDAVDLLRHRNRTYTWGNAEQARHDPQLLQVVGSLSAAAFVVEAAVLAAADAQDRADAAFAGTGTADDALALEASLLASRVKVGVEDLALRAAGELFAVGGASATRASAHLDRHWRNLRTLFSHNPTVYKARAIGDHLVNGTPLPQVGFF